MRRATILQPPPSDLNIFTPASELSVEHPISMDHNRRLINEIIDEIFDQSKGNVDVSSSQCSTLPERVSEYSYDKRLQYWKNVLRDRENLGEKICSKAKKTRDAILYNRLTTVDERNKKTITRILDYAERMEPLRLLNLQPSRLKTKCVVETGLIAPEVLETLPRSEIKKKISLEITGMPNVVKVEMLGKKKHQGTEKPYAWLQSKVLGQRIERNTENIERVVEYYPDIENLQVVGESLLTTAVAKKNSDIKLLAVQDTVQISSDSYTEECKAAQTAPPSEESQYIEFGVCVNDTTFVMKSKRSSKNITVQANFSGQPFTKRAKHVLTIKNIGHKILNFDWSHRCYYENQHTFYKPMDNEFQFDTKPFRLYRNESKEFWVVYQPRRVDVVKSKWILKVEPQFFCRKLDGIVMLLTGVCSAPPEYESKLNSVMCEVIGKSNLKMMRQLDNSLASMVPLITPPEVICPYQRSLKEIEVFEQLNPGYFCERYHDIELLRDIHKRAKKPRQPAWDLKINSLKCTIFRIPNAAARATFLNELWSVLETMKGKSVDLETRLKVDPEKERTKLLYVRGIICTSIDEWEVLIENLEESYFQTCLTKFFEDIHKYLIEQIQNDIQNENAIDLPDDIPELDDEDAVRHYVIKSSVRPLKSFRDCLYMQTYTTLCNFIEDIVNVLESLDMV